MHSLPRFRCLSLLLLKHTQSHHVKQIHAQLLTNGIKSPSSFAKLIEQYCALSSPSSKLHAHLVFAHFDLPNLFLFNTLIRCTQPEDSILVFATRGDLVFDYFTYIFVLGACARASSVSTLWLGRQIHAQVLKFGVLSNILLQTTLIHFYASNRDIYSARLMFDEMLVRSSVTWNAMITGYSSQKERAEEGARDALVLFKDMLVDVGGVKPTATTTTCILSATSQLGMLETGACVHGYVEKTLFAPENDVFVGTGLVDMYSKCGCLDSALVIFRQMREKNVRTWTAMMTGLALHGKGEEALKLLDDMGVSGVSPNAVTFTSLISACCHAGLVEVGLHLFSIMKSRFGLEPQIQHYGCIVDLLGRAGHLKEAFQIIIGMSVEPDAILWRSLLSACKLHGDVLMGEKVGKILLQLQPESNSRDSISSEDYVALSNVYALSERWQEVEIVRKEMYTKRIEIEPGRSFSPNHQQMPLGGWACQA